MEKQTYGVLCAYFEVRRLIFLSVSTCRKTQVFTSLNALISIGKRYAFNADLDVERPIT